MLNNSGFLKLDNCIVDHWMSKLNHSEFKVILAIYRKTVGWNKKEDKLSQSQLAELTGLTTRSVRTALIALENMKLIKISGKSKSIKTISLIKENIAIKQENTNKTKGKNYLHKRQPTKDTNTINISFDIFWSMYDYKKGKVSDVEAKWNSLSESERQLTIETLQAYVDSTPNKLYRKHPMTYLEQEAWNDEVVALDSTITDTHVDNNKYIEIFNQHKNKALGNTINNTDDDSPFTEDVVEVFNTRPVSGSNSNYSASFKEFDAEESTPNKLTDGIIHWWDMKQRGMLKVKHNPSAIKLNTDKSKEVDDFLSKYGSKKNNNNVQRVY